MKIKISPQAVFILSIILFPVNYSLAVSMRPSDVIVVCSFILFLVSRYPVRINLTALLWLLLSISSILLAVIWNLRWGGDLERVIFLYKYVLVFLLVFLALNTFKHEPYILIASKVFYFSLIALSIWVFVYYYLIFSSVIVGSFRPSFPLSNSYLESDAHLYSSVLAMLLFSYVYMLRIILGHKARTVFITLALISLAIIFTGSRTGVALLVIGFGLQLLVSLIFSYKTTYLLSLNRAVFYVFSAGLVILFSPFIFDFLDIDLAQYASLVERAFNFDLGQDASSLSRYRKFVIALNDFSNSGFIGAGPIHASVDWYDNLIASLFAHGGILLFCSSVFVVIVCYMKAFHQDVNGVSITRRRATYLILLFMYCIANVITEYILVTRSALPSISLIVMAFYWSRNNQGIKDSK